MTGRDDHRLARRVSAAAWAAGLAFSAGYVPTWLLKGDPRVSIVASAVIGVPVGARSLGGLSGLIRGALAGLAAGTGITLALSRQGPLLLSHAAPFVAAPVFLCALVSALFGFLAARRRAVEEDQ